jgi:hypothetical protein
MQAIAPQQQRLTRRSGLAVIEVNIIGLLMAMSINAIAQMNSPPDERSTPSSVATMRRVSNPRTTKPTIPPKKDGSRAVG